MKKKKKKNSPRTVRKEAAVSNACNPHSYRNGGGGAGGECNHGGRSGGGGGGGGPHPCRSGGSASASRGRSRWDAPSSCGASGELNNPTGQVSIGIYASLNGGGSWRSVLAVRPSAEAWIFSGIGRPG